MTNTKGSQMPLITKFQLSEKTGGKLQPTQVVGLYRVFERDGYGPVLQIDTNGSETRAKPNKQSQTIQLNEASAKDLWLLLGKHYRFKA
jgi:hypothetical protein